MKKIIFVTIITLTNIIFGQTIQHGCKFGHTQQMLQYETQRAVARRLAAPTTYDALTPYVFNLSFYQLNLSDGSNMSNNIQLTVDNQIIKYKLQSI